MLVLDPKALSSVPNHRKQQQKHIGFLFVCFIDFLPIFSVFTLVFIFVCLKPRICYVAQVDLELDTCFALVSQVLGLYHYT